MNVGASEAGEAPVTITGQAAADAEPDPHVARAVFGKRDRVKAGERSQAVLLSVGMKSPGGPVPARKTTSVSSAHPDVAARIFKQTEDVVTGKPVARGVDGFGRRAGETVKAVYFRQAVQTLAGRHPPLGRAVFQHELIPPPAKISGLGEPEPNRGEALAIESVNQILLFAGDGDYIQPFSFILENRSRALKPIRFAEGSNAAAR